MEFNQALRMARENCKLSIRDLSQKVSMSEKVLQSFEDGSCLPFLADFVEICRVLNITPNDLLVGVTFSPQACLEKRNYYPSYQMNKTLSRDEKIKYVRGLRKSGFKIYPAKLQLALRIGFVEAEELIKITETMETVD